MPHPPNPLPALVEGTARALAGLARDAPAGVYHAVAEDTGVKVEVTVTVEERVKPATECEVDLITTLGDARLPWTTSRVLRELDRRGQVHGESTVKRCLARLVRQGTIISRTRPPRGYHLPELGRLLAGLAAAEKEAQHERR